jgi:hypothetical protein
MFVRAGCIDSVCSRVIGMAVTFLQHSMLLFWNRFEVPALQSGAVSVDNPRPAGKWSWGRRLRRPEAKNWVVQGLYLPRLSSMVP